MKRWKFARIGLLLICTAVSMPLAAKSNKDPLALQLKRLKPVKLSEIKKLTIEDGDISGRYMSVLKTAKSFLGIKYLYGGEGKDGLDCSAFVQKVYKEHGKKLPRTSNEQYRCGRAVTKQDLKPGDLVFFSDGNKTIGHVGIYLGNNKFIHASSGAHKVTITDLDKAYYKKHFMGGRRF
jgi:hypothetical protein